MLIISEEICTYIYMYTDIHFAKATHLISTIWKYYFMESFFSTKNDSYFDRIFSKHAVTSEHFCLNNSLVKIEALWIITIIIIIFCLLKNFLSNHVSYFLLKQHLSSSFVWIINVFEFAVWVKAFQINHFKWGTLNVTFDTARCILTLKLCSNCKK